MMGKLASVFVLFFMYVSLVDAGTLGNYIVPTDQIELMNFSNFELSNVEFGEDELTFSLPGDLTPLGDQKVSFFKTDDKSNIYESELGSAKCTKDSKMLNVICDIQYNSLYSEYSMSRIHETEQHILSQTINQDESFFKIEVARAFASDPIGKLIIKL